MNEGKQKVTRMPVHFVDSLGKEQNKPEEQNPERKQYLLLFIFDDPEVIERTWEMVQGRITAYNHISDIFYNSSGGLNLNNSRVMTETHTFNESISFLEFIQFINKNNLIDEYEQIDISEYSSEEFYI